MKNIWSVEETISRTHLTRPKPTLNYNQKGITLVALIITIIVMLILASVTVYVGTENIENSRMISFVSYMQTIQKKVDFIAEYEDFVNYGEELTSNNKSTLQDILNSENENFLTTIDSTYLRFFDSRHIASDLEIENIDDEIVVDFNTREVIRLNGIKYEGKVYYTQYNLPGGQTLKQNEEIERTVGWGNIVTSIDGLNGTFTVQGIGITNGTLSCGRKNANGEIIWSIVSNYTKIGESITTKNITESGTYYFKLTDNVTGKDSGVSDENGNITYASVDLKLTNTPKLKGNLTDLSSPYNYSNLNNSTQWAFATDKTDENNLLYYVWIPRYAYKLNASGGLEELQFLRGTSDITTSGGYIDSTWTVPNKFTDGTKELTGVWLQVTSPGQTRNRHNR